MDDHVFRKRDRVETTDWEPHVPVGARGRVVYVYDDPETDGVDVLLDDGRQLNILPWALALVPTTKRPRGTCSVCEEDRALTKDGLLGHHAGPPGSDPGNWLNRRAYRCAGAGKPPKGTNRG